MGSIYWIYLAQDRDKWRAVVKTVTNLWVIWGICWLAEKLSASKTDLCCMELEIKCPKQTTMKGRQLTELTVRLDSIQGLRERGVNSVHWMATDNTPPKYQSYIYTDTPRTLNRLCSCATKPYAPFPHTSTKMNSKASLMLYWLNKSASSHGRNIETKQYRYWNDVTYPWRHLLTYKIYVKYYYKRM